MPLSESDSGERWQERSPAGFEQVKLRVMTTKERRINVISKREGWAAALKSKVKSQFTAAVPSHLHTAGQSLWGVGVNVGFLWDTAPPP